MGGRKNSNKIIFAKNNLKARTSIDDLILQDTLVLHDRGELPALIIKSKTFI